ncbi:replication initiation protein RepC [Tianweitania sp. BSSL-BM11]|uniref:Replication initiation protein RepC n=1 Tax=Tianweitania aestuarii TaxID=2814886 RepID=A0ABS5S102_9HYPH|nr:plasmid replication protein RepC [Tianweitania aestuarii]MBS9722144.1 replication initiation protein RepC [Tianweitania aestuarii]
MRETVVSTPFGRRPMTLALLVSQVANKDIPDKPISKWQVFQHVREAREHLGASDRALAILNALLSFYPEPALSAKTGTIVWPSNEQLCARANGMSLATLRRHIAILLDCGLILRRDSPNGKRFARKGEGGSVVQAYGFDLAPLLTRADEFRRMAETIIAERQALKILRERMTLCRRDIVKLIESGRENSIPHDWNEAEESYRTIIAELPRKATKPILEQIEAQLETLRRQIINALDSFINAAELSRNESQSETHKQESKPESQSESVSVLEKRNEAALSLSTSLFTKTAQKPALPLPLVLEACSSLNGLAQGGEIRNWRDFSAATTVVRSMLQITPSTWQEACGSLGEQQAAITLGAIYQRSGAIVNPGGYLRVLSRRAQSGRFSATPMIMALRRTSDKPESPSAPCVEPAIQSGEENPADDIPISAALLRSLAQSNTLQAKMRRNLIQP